MRPSFRAFDVAMCVLFCADDADLTQTSRADADLGGAAAEDLDEYEEEDGDGRAHSAEHFDIAFLNTFDE